MAFFILHLNMKLVNKTILIVGASTGIGKALAINLAQFNNRIAIVARREKELQEVKQLVESHGSDCLAITSDAIDTNKAQIVVKTIIKHFNSIDLAILNVGAGPQMDLKKIDAQTVINNMNLNYNSMVNYLFPVLRHMQEKDNGMIVHINSLAGLRAIPMQGPYSAAKGAARLLMETCRMEFQNTNIKFSTIHPGYVETERVLKYDKAMPFSISAEKAANKIISAIERQKEVYAFPFIMNLVIKLLNLLPRKLTSYILMK